MFPVSIQLYTVRQYNESEGREAILQHLASAGYDGVEPGDVGPDPAAYLRFVRSLGMTVSSWFGPFPDPDKVSEIIETAQALEVKNVVCGLWIPDFENADAIRKTADRLNPAVEALQSAGLNLCLHNHWFEFDQIDGKFAVEHLLDACPGLQLELDVYWAAAFGENDVAKIVTDQKSRIPLLHVKDGPLVKGEPHTALGEGKLDLRPIVEAADPEVLKWLVVELDECATDMWTAVEASVRFLRESGLASANA